MTHSLLNELPYAPKVGEMWETDKYGVCVLLEVSEVTTVVQQIEVDKQILFGNKLILINKNNNLVRRHVRDKSERDNAPTIPPVEGAKMICRNGTITGVITLYSQFSLTFTESDNGDIPEILHDKYYYDDEYSYEEMGWDKDGEPLKGCPFTSFIAVHTWPEDVNELAS